MSHEKMTYEDLLQIIELVKQSEQWSEFHLKVGDLEVDFKRASLGAGAPSANTPPATATAKEAAPPAAALEHPAVATLAHSAAATLVKSPMVGTFYRAPEPGARPFVDAGQQVTAETIVCIIEVMKLMNSIPAGASGVVTQIAVPDGEAVEYGQVLMVIEPR
ncbi:MAG TPA: acetyl-CoA carboxylase biotin carboxyl carrier protein [Casimicrobiaceae bacterium]|jgi:acetyl-CoA carboxylase biotin carboxyl carrier protein